MEFSDVLRRRRMVRNYDSTPVPEAMLVRLVEAGLRAPSAGNTRGVGFVVVTDPATRRQIAALADEPEYVARGFDPWISAAPAHLVITVSEEAYHRRYRAPDKLGPDGAEIEWPVPYWWVDAGAALMAVLLAAVDEGLAAGFLGVHSIADLGKLLGIPDEHRPIGVITVGRPLPDRRSASLDRPGPSRDEMVHRDRWR